MAFVWFCFKLPLLTVTTLNLEEKEEIIRRTGSGLSCWASNACWGGLRRISSRRVGRFGACLRVQAALFCQIAYVRRGKSPACRSRCVNAGQCSLPVWAIDVGWEDGPTDSRVPGCNYVEFDWVGVVATTAWGMNWVHL